MKIDTEMSVILVLASIVVCLTALGAQETAALQQPRPALSEQTSRSVWDGVYTEEQAKRGAELYSQECASCHGADLTGRDDASPLAGPAFLSNWGGLTIGDLFERVRVSMPPNKKERLAREKIVDILTHVLRVNGYPAGKTELERKTEELKQIRVEATKP